MDPIATLHSRVSVPLLAGPEPNEKQLQDIYSAALRAADHAMLRPWRFLVIRKQGREKLADLFVKVAQIDDPRVSDEKLARVRAKPLRAPLLIVAIASLQEHAKVPHIEQLLSTGAAVQNMLNAAHMSGLGGMWRTGSMAYHETVKEGLGLSGNERIVGFLYLGQVSGKVKSLPGLAVDDYFREWHDESLQEEPVQDAR